MEQQLAFALGGDERPLTGARISGIPAYRLTGVTDANRDLVKSTEMWVHHPHLGDEGWYLAVPDAWYDAAAQGLGDHGLGLEYLGRLPKRSNALFYLGLAGGVVAVYVLGAVIAHIGDGIEGAAGNFGFGIFVGAVFVALMLLNHRIKSAAQYGALLALTGGNGGTLDADSTFHYPYGSAGSLPLPGDIAYAFRS